MPLLSVVTPVYREEHNIPEFLTRITAILAPITPHFEIIFSMDPSPDRTEEVISAAQNLDPRIKLLKFSRRIGQPMATLAGLQYATGEAVIVIDVDLQDPPHLIPEMVSKWREGFEVVIPQRISRTGEPWLKILVAKIGYATIQRISAYSIPPNTGDFRLLSRRVVQHLNSLSESHGFLRGMTAVVGFNQCLIPFERPPRHSGQTNYNRFLGSLKIGFNGIFCFSDTALNLSTITGFLCLLLSFCLGLVALFYPLFAVGTHILMLFLGGIQLISVGILGQYISRIYDEVKRRPKFILERAVGFTTNPCPLHQLP